jgi:hypothetical protein
MTNHSRVPRSLYEITSDRIESSLANGVLIPLCSARRLYGKQAPTKPGSPFRDLVISAGLGRLRFDPGADFCLLSIREQMHRPPRHIDANSARHLITSTDLLDNALDNAVRTSMHLFKKQAVRDYVAAAKAIPRPRGNV